MRSRGGNSQQDRAPSCRTRGATWSPDPSGEFLVTRQVQGLAGKSSCSSEPSGSNEGQTWSRNHQAGPRSIWEVTPWSQAQAGLWETGTPTAQLSEHLKVRDRAEMEPPNPWAGAWVEAPGHVCQGNEGRSGALEALTLHLCSHSSPFPSSTARHQKKRDFATIPLRQKLHGLHKRRKHSEMRGVPSIPACV